MRHLTVGLFILLALSSCANRSHVPEKYLDITKDQALTSTLNKTVVFFLIDGLSTSVLEQQLKNNNLPQMKKFFLKPGQSVSKARSVFPSLTFTNISGILHEQPVHKTGSLGNKLIFNNKLIDFELLSDRPYFSELMRTKNIFTRLSEKKYFSVSFDYGLGSDATVSSGFDFQSGYAASQLDYGYLDRKKIDGLRILLTETSLKNWPHFVFIHLVGLDFLSHRFGPLSTEAIEYLKRLDSDLQAVLQLLKASENSRQIVTMLSADHGFNLKQARYFNIENEIKVLDPKLRSLNESRFAGLYFLDVPTDLRIKKVTASLVKNKNIEIVAFRNKLRIYLVSKKQEIFFEQQPLLICGSDAVGININAQMAVCSDAIPEQWRDKFHPYFLENMASYFAADKAADIIVIPKVDVIFSQNGLGFHGGPTADEIFVPLLLRNARVSLMKDIPSSWQLLKFIGL